MKIEVLYPEVGNLFGDLANISYLEKCTNADVIYTSLKEAPKFLTEKIDLVYMGSMMESHQELVINALKKYSKEIKKYIKDDNFMLITGNSLEVFGDYIENEDGSKIEGLKILSFNSKRDFSKHHASHLLGEFEGIKIVGHKSQFSHSYNSNYSFINVISGYGLDGNKEGNEGIHENNFYATYLVGPFLIQNPLFTEYLLKEMKVKYELAFKEDIMKSYEIRLNEYTDERMKF